MVTIKYPAEFNRNEGLITVSFPDFPEHISQGKDQFTAMSAAKETLTQAVNQRLETDGEVPKPSPPHRQSQMVPVTLKSRH